MPGTTETNHMHSDTDRTVEAFRLAGRGAVLGWLPSLVMANLAYVAVSYVITSIVSGIVTGSSALSLLGSVLISFLISLFVGILQYGLYSMYLNRQFDQPVRSADLYRGFREQPDRIIKVQAVFAAVEAVAMLPLQVYSFRSSSRLSQQLAEAGQSYNMSLIWSSLLADLLPMLLLYLLGYAIVLYVNIQFAPIWFLMLDFPELSERQLFETSLRLMNKRKLQYFLLQLSFLPLYLLSLLSFGIASLWVMAWHYSSNAAFYKELLKE